MKTLLPLLAALAGCAARAGSAPCAAAETWTVLPEGSTVAFSGTSTLHDFAGTAKLSSGLLRLDGAVSAGAVEADATSLNTAHAGRDKKMHGEIMATATWNRVAFELRRFEPSPDGGTAHGFWTMRGVAREIAIPVRIAAGRASASFTLDIRDWDVPVPRAALVISVDPRIAVRLDLALAAADAAAAAPAATSRAIAGIALVDAAGAPAHPAAGRPLVVFDEDGVAEAKRWIAQLAPKLPAGREAQPVLDATGLSERDRAKALRKAPAGTLVDPAGALRTALRLPKREAQVVPVDALGAAGGPVDGEPGESGRDLVLRRCGIALP